MKFQGKVIELLPWLKTQTDADLRGQPAVDDEPAWDQIFDGLEARTHGAGVIDPPRCRCGGAHDEDDCSYASVRGRPW